MGWLVFLAVALPLLGLLAWLLLEGSVLRIDPGRQGLLLVRGVATDRVLQPGVHWVPAFRRRMVVQYQALEMAYRAGDRGPVAEAELECAGPPVAAVLADRTAATVAYTVRFRLDPTALRAVHNRFGADGVWAAVRDLSGRTVRGHLAVSARVDDLFDAGRSRLEAELATAVGDVLEANGFAIVMFVLGDVDLGRTGDVIQATARAELELRREEAESAMRIARARIDAELAPFVDLPTTEAAIRYREVDSWRDVASSRGAGMLPAGRPPFFADDVSERVAAPKTSEPDAPA